MKKMRLLSISMTLAILLSLFATVTPGTARHLPQDGDAPTIRPGEVVVLFEPGAMPQAYAAQASALAGEMGAQVGEVYGDQAVLRFDEAADVAALAAQIASQPGVLAAAPNEIARADRFVPAEMTVLSADVTRVVNGRPVETPGAQVSLLRRGINGRVSNVPTYPEELTKAPASRNWGWWNVAADIIWPNKALSPSICLLSTGIDDLHPDLKGRVVKGSDFVNEDKIPNDDNGLGTALAGVLVGTINNKIGLAGVSNGQVLAVKVLDAQANGALSDVLAGIQSCADNTTVKVIMVHLAWENPSPAAREALYQKLNYAINTKGKLVLAPSGNTSTSEVRFPGAWAGSLICRDGDYVSDPPAAYEECTQAAGYETDPSRWNTIHQGMLATSAQRSWTSNARDNNSDGLLWVDVDGDGIELDDTNPNFWDEHYPMESCLSDFSNYGAWVQMIGPGEGIYSASPISYAYYTRVNNNVDVDGDGYHMWSGSSFAAAYTAAAAARTWGIFAGDTNASIKNRLLNTPLEKVFERERPGGLLGLDSFDGSITQPELGYDEDPADLILPEYQGEAPFCWPSDFPPRNEHSMGNATFLNVAASMKRAGAIVNVTDAVTALPLSGTSVTAYNGLTLLDTASVASPYNAQAALINLPTDWLTPVTVALKANKTGYTTGVVQFATIELTEEGSYWTSHLTDVSIPPTGRLAAVVNWPSGDIRADLYAWLPNIPATGGGAVIGLGPLDHSRFIGQGDPANAAGYFARWNRDGGGWLGDQFGMESISIAPRPGSTTMPYYNTAVNQRYTFLMTDYSTGSLNINPDLGYYVFRMWVGGKPLVTVVKNFDCNTAGPDTLLGTDDDESWWLIGYMELGAFTEVNVCGDPDTDGNGPDTSTVWPYVGGNAMRRTDGKP